MSLKPKTLLILFILSLVYMNCNKKNNLYKIKATIDGVKENSKVVLFSYEENKVIDSTTIKNGEFNFTGNVKYPFPAVISIDDDWLLMNFWVEKGEILINTDKQTIKKYEEDDIHPFVKANKINSLSQRYNAFMKPLQDEKALKYKQMKKGIISELDFKKQIDTICDLAYSFLNKKENVDNYFSLSEIIGYKEGISKKDLNAYYIQLSNRLKKSPKGKVLNSFLTYKGVKVGEIAPNIITRDLKGKK